MLLLWTGQVLHVAKSIESRPHPLIAEISHDPINLSYPALLFSLTLTLHSSQIEVFTKHAFGSFVIAFADLPEVFPFLQVSKTLACVKAIASSRKIMGFGIAWKGIQILSCYLLAV